MKFKKDVNPMNMSLEEKRAYIVKEHNKGVSYKELARRTGYHPNSVRNVYTNFCNRRSFNKRNRGGRHNKLQPSAKRAILNSIRANPQLSCDHLKVRLHLKS